MKHNWDDPAYKERDNEWQAQMRLRQSWYRQIHLGQEAGVYRNKERGNYLPVSAPVGLNFLDEEIAAYVAWWMKSGKQPKAVADPDRLRRNMLSSQPLCFNLFVPLAKDLELATSVIGELSNGRVYQVREVKFEYSPGRNNDRYTGDGTAYDIFVVYQNSTGGEGFLGIEVKYHEDLSGKKLKEKNMARYQEIAQEAGCFRPSYYEELYKLPLAQIWRDHLLASSQKIADGFDDALSVLLHPADNEACREAAVSYQKCLTERSSFEVWTIDEMVELIREKRPSKWIEDFYTRYLGDEFIADQQTWPTANTHPNSCV